MKSVDEMTLTEVRALVDTLETRNEELVGQIGTDMVQEAGEFSTAQLALEDIGWRPLIGIADDANQFTLEGLHRVSELCRAVATVNPLVKRGLLVRTGYIWGSGVQIVAREFAAGPGRPRTVNTTPKMPDGIEDVLTSVIAQMEIERSAATDGNLFFLVDKKAKTVQRVPFYEVSEGVSARGNREKLMYIRRTWNDWDLDSDPDGTQARPFTEPQPGNRWVPEQPKAMQDQVGGTYRNTWYPTPAAAGDNRKSIAGDEVDNSKVMVHVAFNRLVGWRWGVPDVLPAIWWTKAYKEFLENSATLTKAYARFAWKVTSDRSRTVKRTAATLAQTPARDPATGMPLGIGGSAVLGAGQDLSAIQRNTSVDFDSGRPLAAMIAAALDVPLPALTCDPTLGSRATAQALDTSTILVMQARQKAMNEAIMLIFQLLGLKVRLRWPDISEEPVHRRVQAIDMAARLGVLRATETRTMVLDAWHGKWDDFEEKPPTEAELPIPIRSRMAAASANKPTGAGSSDPGGRGSKATKQPDPMSRGDHELRDEGMQSHTDTA
jgi:hypothetical protein